MTVDVEEWYHILDTPSAPALDQWEHAECRIDRNLPRLLEVFAQEGAQATFFWLGWLAQRHKDLVRQCVEAGHEVASHGYGHVLAYQVGPKAFGDDMVLARKILEDMTGREVAGFRAPGFGITEQSPWAFEVIRQSGHRYDASVFPASRAHGGMRQAPVGPYVIQTRSGPLMECPMSVVEVAGKRLCLFSGGYLRLAPMALIRWGAGRLARSRLPLIVLVHPREIDVDQPRLDLPFGRKFKCYVNLKSTMGKIRRLCREYRFHSMARLVESAFKQDRPTLAPPDSGA
jgi:polysaccharide deacetylase family protein (PEP-CTERM system associated)